MTVEEIDILVNASVEQAIKEFKKLYPQIRTEVNKIKNFFNKEDVQSEIVHFDKTKFESNLKEAKKQINGFSKKSYDIKLNPKIEQKENISNIDVQKPETSKLEKMYADWGQGKIGIDEIRKYKQELNQLYGNIGENGNSTNNAELDTLKSKISQIKPYIEEFKNQFNFEPLKNQISGIRSKFDEFKSSIAFGGNSAQLDLINYKINEIEEKLQNTKEGKIHLDTKEIISAEAELERLKNQKEKLEQSSGGGFFSKLTSSIKNILPNMNSMNKAGIQIKNSIKGFGSGFKTGLGNIVKYAGALFSLRGVYSTLRASASAWLSSQNIEAQQATANIEYMKYALGSVLAPVIQYLTNLAYQLMKALQSVVYAFSGVNIFAKATASSMKNASKSAKDTNKSLYGIHSDINNMTESSSSSGSGDISPSMDLSQLENTPNSILDAIKNGDWYQVGNLVGEKINEALASIPWDKIQNTARSIGRNLALFLNGAIDSIDWYLVGNTIAQGLNTGIYFAYGFVTNFNWEELGKAIGTAVNGLFNNIDWEIAGQTLGEGLKGIFNSIYAFFQEVDWGGIARDCETFISNIDWNGVTTSLFNALGSAFGGLGAFIGQLIKDAFSGIEIYFQEKIEECGGNVVAGFFKGIVDVLAGIGDWIGENILMPFIKGFKDAFEIHSPSLVMAELGGYIVEGLFNGITSLIDKVIEIWNNLKTKTVEIVSNIKDKVAEKISNMKENVTQKFTEIKDKAIEKITNLKTNAINTFENIKSTISTKVSNIKDSIVTGFENAVSYIKSLPSQALTWGRDIIGNIVNGITSKISDVKNAISNVASTIASYIHFTEPDVGPLSNFHTYMPDMIDLMRKGIKDNVSSLITDIENMAGEISVSLDTSYLAGQFLSSEYDVSSLNPQIQKQDIISNISNVSENTSRPIRVIVQIGSRTIVDEVLDGINEKRKQIGKDVIKVR